MKTSQNATIRNNPIVNKWAKELNKEEGIWIANKHMDGYSKSTVIRERQIETM